MIPKIVDSIPVCEPIRRVLELLENNGGDIIEQKVSDYHFHELFFKVSISQNVELKSIEGIEVPRENIYCCTCHWSTVEIQKCGDQLLPETMNC